MHIPKAKPFLLYIYVIPFFFWALDVITTLYAIDYLGIAGELNPLGWPLGALGALIFYIPALIFTDLLLSRTKDRFSFWAAILITILAIGLGIMNLSAAIHNISVAEPYTGNSLLSGFREFFNNIFGQVFLCIIILMLAIVGIKELYSKTLTSALS